MTPPTTPETAKQQISQIIRDVPLRLMTYTRSLELCARMNYETENLDFIDAIAEASIFYDLGACEGRFSLYAALKGLRVYAFEPERDNFGVFAENIAINGMSDRIKAFNMGVGDRDRQGTMSIGQPWAGGHQKIVRHEAIREDVAKFDSKGEQAITIVALDHFIETQDLPTPAYMKIDVDGSEVPFMVGAAKTLGSPALKKIIFELDKTDTNYDGIVRQLASVGFRIEGEYKIPNEPALFNIVFSK